MSFAPQASYWPRIRQLFYANGPSPSGTAIVNNSGSADVWVVDSIDMVMPVGGGPYTFSLHTGTTTIAFWYQLGTGTAITYAHFPGKVALTPGYSIQVSYSGTLIPTIQASGYIEPYLLPSVSP